MQRRALMALLAAALLAAGALHAQPAPDKRGEIPFRKEIVPGFDTGRWALGGVATIAAIGAGLGGLWLMRRRLPGILPGMLPGARERRLRLIESLRVSPRTTVLLIEVDGRTLMLGEHAGALVLLSPPVEPRHG